MIFLALPLKGAFLVKLEKSEDSRGFFARSWCKNEFETAGLNTALVQCSISFNKKKKTLRGMHYQAAPYEEVKLVRCTMGAIYDVIIDLRKSSNTFKSWYAIELSAKNHKMLYIPEGFAHGYLTLEDNSEIFYQMSGFYHSECARGVRWDDPVFNIKWPEKNVIIADRDLKYLDFKL